MRRRGLADGGRSQEGRLDGAGQVARVVGDGEMDEVAGGLVSGARTALADEGQATVCDEMMALRLQAGQW